MFNAGLQESTCKSAHTILDKALCGQDCRLNILTRNYITTHLGSHLNKMTAFLNFKITIGLRSITPSVKSLKFVVNPEV